MENNPNQGNSYNTQDTQNYSDNGNNNGTQNTQGYSNQNYSNNVNNNGAQNTQGYSGNNSGAYYNQYNANNSQYGAGYPGAGSNYQSYNYNNQPYGPGYPNEIEKPVSMGDWIITLIVLAIPVVNLVMLFVWGFSNEVSESKKNFCRAELIVIGVVIALCIILFVVVGISAATAISNNINA